MKKLFIFIGMSIFISLFVWNCTSPEEELRREDFEIENIKINTLVTGAILPDNNLLPLSFEYEELLEIEPDSFVVEFVEYESEESVFEIKYLFLEEINIFMQSEEYEAKVLSGSLQEFINEELQRQENLRLAEIEVLAEQEDGQEEQFENDNTSSDKETFEDENLELLASEEELQEEFLLTSNEITLSNSGYNFNIPYTRLDDGFYKLQVKYYNEGNFLGSFTNPVFSSSNKVSPRSVGHYPSIVPPEGDFLLYFDTQSNNADETFVRFMLDDKVVFATALSEIERWPHIKLSGEKSVQSSFTLEVYPFMPPSGLSEFDFPSPYNLKGSILIGDSLDFGKNGIYSDGVFSVLHHFNGTLKDTINQTKTKIEGTPLLSIAKQNFGYTFNNGAKIIYDSGLLPVNFSGDKGQLQPFTLFFAGELFAGSEEEQVVDGEEMAETVFTSEYKNFSFQFALQEGLPQATITYNDIVTTLIPEIPVAFKGIDENNSKVAVSYYYDNENSYFLWYLNEELYSISKLPFHFSEIAKGGDLATLGSSLDNGSVIDEFGIYIADINKNSGIYNFDQLNSSELQGQVESDISFDKNQKDFYINGIWRGNSRISESQLTLSENSSYEQVYYANASQISFKTSYQSESEGKIELFLGESDFVTGELEATPSILFDLNEKQIEFKMFGDTQTSIASTPLALSAVVASHDYSIFSFHLEKRANGDIVLIQGNTTYPLALEQMPTTFSIKFLANERSAEEESSATSEFRINRYCLSTISPLDYWINPVVIQDIQL